MVWLPTGESGTQNARYRCVSTDSWRRPPWVARSRRARWCTTLTGTRGTTARKISRCCAPRACTWPLSTWSAKNPAGRVRCSIRTSCWAPSTVRRPLRSSSCLWTPPGLSPAGVAACPPRGSPAGSGHGASGSVSPWGRTRTAATVPAGSRRTAARPAAGWSAS